MPVPGARAATCCSQLMSRPTPIRSLTGLRFFAALAVVLFHNVSVAGSPDFVERALRRGEVAVPFFFALSGFVLAYGYAGARRVVERGRFLVARLARLYPTYLLALLVALPFFVRLLHLEHGDGAVRAGLTIAPTVLLMVQAWVPLGPVTRSWNTPAWSLSVELFLYLAFLPLVAVVRRMQARALALAATALAALAFAAWVGLPAVLPARGMLLGIEGPFAWRLSPLVHLPTFALGAVLGRLFLLVRDRQGAARAAGPLSVVVTLALLAIVALAPADRWHSGWEGTLPGLFGVLILAVAWDRGPLAWLATRPAVMALGEASYALYLLHAPVWAWLQVAWTRGLGLRSGALADKPLAFDVAYVVLSVAASLAAYRWFEVPARAWVLSRVHRPAEPPTRGGVEPGVLDPTPGRA